MVQPHLTTRRCEREAAVIYCPNCGEANDESARFCDNCGRDLQDAREARNGNGGGSSGAGDSSGGTQDVASSSQAPAEVTLWEGRPGWFTSPGRAFTTRYKVTNRRLVINRGFISRNSDETDIFRFSDVGVTQGVFQRITGRGNVELSGSDQSTPTLELHNIGDPDRVKDLIRDAAHEERDRRRIRYREEM